MYIGRLDAETDLIARPTVGPAHGEDADLLSCELRIELGRQTKRLDHFDLCLQRIGAANFDIFRADTDGDPVAILDLQFRPYCDIIWPSVSSAETLLPSRATTAGRKFMPGEPMNPATNRLAG